MKKQHFTAIIVIYNPKSTGSGKDMALQLKHSLKKYDLQLVATEYAGHAEELAYTYANMSSRPLIISASGDGGYHEVVNGLIRAQLEGATPTAGLLPAGNANDHYHDVHTTDVVTAITNGHTQCIDLLKLAATVQGKPWSAYAHSYIGFGLTPKVGKELNETELRWFNEIWIVLKALFALKPIKIIVDDKPQRFDSLIASNVSTMSKVLNIAEQARNNDGKFEITTFTHRPKLELFQQLVLATTVGLRGQERYSRYIFRTIKKTLVQLDGEIATIDADSKVVIAIEPQILHCII